MEYDAYDNIETITDRHYQVEMEYTPLGSLKKRRQAGTEIEFYYDNDNKLTALRNEKNEHYQQDATGCRSITRRNHSLTCQLGKSAHRKITGIWT